MEKQKKQDLYSCAGAALLTILTGSLIFLAAGRFPGQSRLFLDGDTYYQYMQAIAMLWRHLLNRESLQYSFEFSMGMQTVTTYTGSCLSPFHLFFALIADVNTAAFAVVILKLATAAAAFAFLLRRSLNSSMIPCMAFSAAYALCGFSINFYTIISFLDALYVLPLLILALRNFVKYGKWIVLSLLYAYIFILQAYMGYVIGLFSAGIYLLLAWLEFGKEGKRYLKSMGSYVICVFCALLLSMFSLLPQAYWIAHYTPEDATAFAGLQFRFWELPGAFFLGQGQGIYNTQPMVYAGLPVLFLLPGFFMDKTVERKKRVAAAVLLILLCLATLWDPFYLLMHGFDNPDSCAFRYSFFWPFVLLYLAAWEWEKGQSERKKIFYLLCGGFWVLSYVLLLPYQARNLAEDKQTLSVFLMEINLLFLFAYVVLSFVAKEKKRRDIGLLVLLCLELLANGFFILTPDVQTAQRSKWYYQIWNDQARSSLAQIEEMEKDDPWEFYRVHYHNAPMENFPMLYAYNGISMFSTQENENSRLAMMKQGYATSVKIVADYGSTALMRMLLAQKYTVNAGHPRIGNVEEYSVVKNENTLPLGYMVSGEMRGYHADSGSAFENQNRLISAMCGEEMAVYSAYEGALEIETKSMDVEAAEGAVLLRRTAEADEVGSALYRFRDEGEGQMYAYFYRDSGSFKDAASPAVFSAVDAGLPNQVPYLSMLRIFPLIRNEEGEYESVIYMYPEGYQEYTYKEHYFARENTEEIKYAYSLLKDGGWEIENFRDDKISGKVRVTEERPIFFTSIPYEEGWSAKVDGKAVETIALMDNAFLGLELTPGEHIVELEYHMPYIGAGIGISLSAAVIMIVLVTVLKIQKKKKLHE